jgi:hypothetical protein
MASHSDASLENPRAHLFYNHHQRAVAGVLGARVIDRLDQLRARDLAAVATMPRISWAAF